jgi:transposase
VPGQTADMAGRPSKLTPERRDDLTLMLAHGVPVGVAAKSVGVSARTLRRWLAEGDLRERIAEIRSARRTGDGAASEARMVVLLLKASEHDWRASAWWLERRWPERWALRASSASPRVRQDSEAWTSRR